MELLGIELVDSVSPPVLHVKGEIDIATAGQLEAALGQALARDPTVVVDMTGVLFIDAAGLRVLLEAAETLNGASPLRIRNAPLVERLLTLVGLGDVQSIELQEVGEVSGG